MTTYSCMPCLVYMPIQSAMPKSSSEFPKAFFGDLVCFSDIKLILSNRTYSMEIIVSSHEKSKTSLKLSNIEVSVWAARSHFDQVRQYWADVHSLCHKWYYYNKPACTVGFKFLASCFTAQWLLTPSSFLHSCRRCKNKLCEDTAFISRKYYFDQCSCWVYQ